MSYISDLIWHVTAKRGNFNEEITGRWQNNSLGHAPNKYVLWAKYVMNRLSYIMLAFLRAF